MKKFLVQLNRSLKAFIPFEADIEFHETDCANKARRLLRLNGFDGVIEFTEDMDIEAKKRQIEDLRLMGANVTYEIHTKTIGRAV